MKKNRKKLLLLVVDILFLGIIPLLSATASENIPDQHLGGIFYYGWSSLAVTLISVPLLVIVNIIILRRIDSNR